MALQEEFESQGNWLFKYRGSLPFIPLVIGAFLFVQVKLNPALFCIEDSPYELYYELFCLAISLFGLAIRIYTIGHTHSNTSGRNTEDQIADNLNTTGIYSMVRHPLYLGNFFMWIGPAMLTGNLWFVVAFCLFYWLYYERIMFAEEQFLRRKFGNAYTDWANSVPSFIPNFKKFVAPKLPMSWKKVIKQEKIGLFLTLLIFASFNVAGNYLQSKEDYNYYLIGACLLSLLLYIVLKIIIKKSNLLEIEAR
ncbi:MAG: methyltransferase family protein [Ferruginibacter sp.]